MLFVLSVCTVLCVVVVCSKQCVLCVLCVISVVSTVCCVCCAVCSITKQCVLCVSELPSMSMKLVSSGSYNVRASEMAHLQDRQPKTVNCQVHFLDETDQTFDIDVSRPHSIFSLHAVVVVERSGAIDRPILLTRSV